MHTAFTLASTSIHSLTTEIDNFLRAAEIDSQYPRPAYCERHVIRQKFRIHSCLEKESCTERRHDRKIRVGIEFREPLPVLVIV